MSDHISSSDTPKNMCCLVFSSTTKKSKFYLFQLLSYYIQLVNDFDDQERDLTFVKMDFQVLKHKFHAYNFKQAYYPLHKRIA